MDEALARRIVEISGARGLGRVQDVARLWGGYGRILRAELDGGPVETVVVKVVQPPPARPGRDARGDARKRRSYDVELAWYRAWASRCDGHPRVARAYGAERVGDGWLFVLEDLDAAGYPGRLRGRAPRELDACLGWLAALHARFLGEAPAGLWPVGTYWHLATRPDELARMRDRDLARAAPELDRRLSGARHRTVVHGDAKPENFCAAKDGAVAAVDFQYAGGGVGSKDVAYLLHGLPERAEAAGRDLYFELLDAELARRADVDRRAVVDEWRELYPLARADFERFLDGWAG